jgi:hypothetical protein
MQTFVTFRDWAQTSSALDDKRAGKQRLEAKQILEHLLGEAPDFYPNHPVMDMWRGYEFALGIYGIQFCMDWYLKRNNNDTIQFEIQNLLKKHNVGPFVSPPWRDDKDLMRSHRSNLVRKDPSYKKVFPKTPEDMPYLWPHCHEDGSYDLRVSAADEKRLKTGERKLSKELRELVGL